MRGLTLSRMTALEVLLPTPVGVAHLSLDVPSRPAALVPTLVVQGSRDAFGSAETVRAAVGDGRVTVAEVADADHSFRARRTDATTTRQALAAVAAAVTPWLAGLAKPAKKPR